jgi:sensor domain CHASE-containing protein
MKHITLPKVPFIKSKHLLIILGIAVVVAVILAGAAEAAHQKRVNDVQAAQTALVQKQHDAAVNKQIADLQASVKLEDAKLLQACTYIKTLALKNKTIVTPQVCVSTI